MATYSLHTFYIWLHKITYRLHTDCTHITYRYKALHIATYGEIQIKSLTAFGDSDNEEGQNSLFECGPELQAAEPEPDDHGLDPAAQDRPPDPGGRAMDMRHILLLLPFLLPNLLKGEVEEYNHLNPFAPISDPSDET